MKRVNIKAPKGTPKKIRRIIEEEFNRAIDDDPKLLAELEKVFRGSVDKVISGEKLV